MSQNSIHENFISLYSNHEPELRAFIRSLLPSWEDTHEVLQNVALVAWKKFDQFDSESGDELDFLRWMCVIARFEVLTYRRSKARDRLSFSPELIEFMADEAEDEIELRIHEHRALEGCLKKLPPEKRELLRIAYTPGVKIVEVADQLGKSTGSLYTMLNRIRAIVLECIGKTLASENGDA